MDPVVCYFTKERKVERNGSFRFNAKGTSFSIEFVQSDIRVLLEVGGGGGVSYLHRTNITTGVGVGSVRRGLE